MNESTMGHGLQHNGEYVIVNDHKIHIYRAGNKNCPKLLFMSGSGTVAPVYDLFSFLIHCPGLRQYGGNRHTNCGHYVHYYESDRISEEIRRFIE